MMLGEHFQQLHQHTVHYDREPRCHVGFAPSQHAIGEFVKHLTDARIHHPDRLLAVPQFSRQLCEIAWIEHHPRWPLPLLVRPAHADIQDQPVKPSPADVRIAQFVQLPRAGECQVAGLQRMRPAVHFESHAAGFEKHDLQSLVAVWIQAPVLRPAAVPEADVREARKDVRIHSFSRVVSLGQRVKLDRSLAHRLELRLAIVDFKAIRATLIDRGGEGLFHGMFNILRRRNLQDPAACK
jgi:hypothetical protein